MLHSSYKPAIALQKKYAAYSIEELIEAAFPGFEIQ